LSREACKPKEIINTRTRSVREEAPRALQQAATNEILYIDQCSVFVTHAELRALGGHRTAIRPALDPGGVGFWAKDLRGEIIKSLQSRLTGPRRGGALTSVGGYDMDHLDANAAPAEVARAAEPKRRAKKRLKEEKRVRRKTRAKAVRRPRHKEGGEKRVHPPGLSEREKMWGRQMNVIINRNNKNN